MGRAIGEAHRRYTHEINFREDWRGYLWQGRFASFPMDERYLLSAAAYVELNPVKAGIVSAPWDYSWSSVHPHLVGERNGIVEVEPLLDLVGDWKVFLSSMGIQPTEQLQSHERTGRPLGDTSFIEKVSKIVGRDFKRKKPGPKVKIN